MGEPEKDRPRRLPTRWQSILILTRLDLGALWRSWLCRGFFLVSTLLTMLTLKGMQSEEAVAAHMLDGVYATYILVWMHVVIFVAGGALTREQDCLNDAILSRGVTRGEYIGSKMLARTAALLFMIVGILLPASFWAIRQDALVRTEHGYLASHSRDTEVMAWEPKQVFAGSSGTLRERRVKTSALVHVGDILGQLDDRELFDTVETRRRAEENARVEVENARRRYKKVENDVIDAEEAVERAKRSVWGAKDLSRRQVADGEADIRISQRDLEDARRRVGEAKDAITGAERASAEAQMLLRDVRERLGHATITSPITGYVIEMLAQEGQQVSRGMHLFTIAPLDEYQLNVPIPDFDEFQRIKKGLTAYVTIEEKEFTGTVDHVSATAEADRWGNKSNRAVVRFSGQGSQGLLGRGADVRIVLPPTDKEENVAGALLDTITGHGVDDTQTRTTSVTPRWMLIGLSKLIGLTCLLIALSLCAAVLFRNALFAILSVTGVWHISNVVFDFVGLPELSYLEVVRTMDKVLGGVAHLGDEVRTLAWLFGITALIGFLTVALFIHRDPPK